MIRRRNFAAVITWFAVGVLAIQASTVADDSIHLYVFSMPECRPCQQMEPDVDRLIQSGYPVTKVDCVSNRAWVDHFQITQTPTIVLTSGNQILGRSVGLMNYAEMVGMFDSVGFRPRSASQPVRVNDQRPSTPSRQQYTATELGGGDRAAATPAQQAAYRATVRLRVVDSGGTSFGTGTVIHRHNDEMLVLTCGHIFRETQGRGKILVDYAFDNGQSLTAEGEMLSYDSETRDIGLVVFRAASDIQPVPVAPRVLPIQANDGVFSIGCNHGEVPTVRDTSVIRTAHYDGAKKYDTIGRPVDGRSGGGLFSAGGQLIGVCNAAAVEVDEGVFSSLENIYYQFDQSNLAHLFDRGAMQTQVAGAATVQSAAGQLTPVNGRGEVLANATTNAVQSANPPVDDVEIILIMRSKSQPELTETVVIDRPSQEFIGLLDQFRNDRSAQHRLADAHHPNAAANR